MHAETYMFTAYIPAVTQLKALQRQEWFYEKGIADLQIHEKMRCT